MDVCRNTRTGAVFRTALREQFPYGIKPLFTSAVSVTYEPYPRADSFRTENPIFLTRGRHPRSNGSDVRKLFARRSKYGPVTRVPAVSEPILFVASLATDA